MSEAIYGIECDGLQIPGCQVWWNGPSFQMTINGKLRGHFSRHNDIRNPRVSIVPEKAREHVWHVTREEAEAMLAELKASLLYPATQGN